MSLNLPIFMNLVPDYIAFFICFGRTSHTIGQKLESTDYSSSTITTTTSTANVTTSTTTTTSTRTTITRAK